MIDVSSVKIALESKGKQRDCLPFLFELIPLFNTNMSFSYKKKNLKTACDFIF